MCIRDSPVYARPDFQLTVINREQALRLYDEGKQIYLVRISPWPILVLSLIHIYVDVGGTYRMEEQSRAQELSVREISLIRELAQIRKEHKRELEYEKFDGYELPPRCV